ncbi:hypothetical protein [Marinicrinis sediminis]|uniref:Uncharacterized protein n=1 Tax=Marinicrinis sediminis TaxID=1652465 RepID=A0ABW5R6J8_9BACL
MENEWIQFLKDEWLIVLVAVIAVVLIIRIVKTMLKWALVLIIAAAVVYYGADYTEDIKAMGNKVGDKIVTYAQDEIYTVMEEEAKQAQFEKHDDGTFTVTSPNVKVEGKANGDEVKVTFKGQSFTLHRSDFVNQFIEQSK